MLLTAQEESLIRVIRGLPPTDASKVLEWARRLSELAVNRRIEWSDSWSDEDLADATTASVRHFKDQEREHR